VILIPLGSRKKSARLLSRTGPEAQIHPINFDTFCPQIAMGRSRSRPGSYRDSGPISRFPPAGTEELGQCVLLF
jgi:hypothetical protein